MRVYESMRLEKPVIQVMECKRAGTVLCVESKYIQLESMKCKASILERFAV